MYRLNIVIIAILTAGCTAIVEFAGDGDHFYNDALKEVNTGPTGGLGAIGLARYTKKYKSDSKFRRKVDKLYAHIQKKHLKDIQQRRKKDCLKQLAGRSPALKSRIERKCGMKMEPEPLMSVTEIDAYAQVCRRAASYDQNISDAYANANYKKCMKNVSRNYYRIKE